jgi:hypothetical protein
MNRAAMGALCVACMFSVIRAKRKWGAPGAFALEQIERAFDVVQMRTRLAKRNIYFESRTGFEQI